MITIKSNREIELMKQAGEICELAHEAVRQAIKPGISTKELDDIAYKVITEHGATPSFLNYNGFPASICASINEVVIHGIPNKNIRLKDGDIISIDIGACYKGYHGDAARTHTCGQVSPEKLNLVKVTEESFFEGIKYAVPGNHLSDISHAIEKYAKKFGYGVITEYTGHGVGTKLHEDPAIPNYGAKGYGPLLKEGMTLAIEPMITQGSPKIKVSNDGWTVTTCDKLSASHYENTIAITKDGALILTKIHKENN